MTTSADRAGVVEPRGRERALALLRAGRVGLGLAGHLHYDIEAMGGDLAMVTTGAVGHPLAGESGYRVVDVDAEGMGHEYHSLGFTL